jgi:amino acid adenylation domain-containing protein
MDAKTIANELTRLNIHISVKADNLSITPPKDCTIAPELLEHIKTNKKALITLLSSQLHKDPPPLVPAARDKVIQLSFAQQRLWFINQFEEGKHTSYNLPAAFRLAGKLNMTALQNTFQTLVDRHESLRTTFQTVGGKAVQVIADELTLDCPVTDITEAEVFTAIQNNVHHIFNLATGPLMIVELFRLSIEEHILLINMHHIISDGWSRAVLIREMAGLYDAYSKGELSTLAPLPIQYADFAIWQREWLQGKVLEYQLNYWKQQLDDAPELLELSTDFPRPAKQRYRGTMEAFKFPKELSDQLDTLTRQKKVTLFMLLMTAFQVLLFRYSGQADICVGTPIANRKQLALANLIGFFVNSLVIRTQVDGQVAFSELLQQVKATSLAAFNHQDLPFEYLVETLNPNRNLSYEPLFQVMFALHNMPTETLELPNVTFSPVLEVANTSKFDLTFYLHEMPEGLAGSVEYNTDLFKQDTIVRLIHLYQKILTAIIKKPDYIIDDIPLLDGKDRQTILVDWNNTDIDYPDHQSLGELFTARANQSPDAVAVVYKQQQLTYRQLDNASNQLAQSLITRGIKPGDKVAICVERSLDLITGMLGIIKAGAAYVPIDPDYPQQRITYMVEDSDSVLLLTHASLIDDAVTKQDGRYLCLDRDWSLIEKSSTETPHTTATADSLAYIIYTSGSTGKPKGVAIPHRAVNRLVFNSGYMTFIAERTFLQLASPSFDAAIFEIWGALLHGAQCILYPVRTPTPETLETIITEHNVDTMFLTTSLFNLIIDERPNTLSNLKTLLTGGEAASVDHFKRAYNLYKNTQIVNLYGPTENTTFTTYYPVSADHDFTCSTIPIGRPIGNTTTYILDDKLRPVPSGIVGRLYTGGAGLALGYVNRPELTEERFIKNPFSESSNARLYDTGDLAKYLPDGNIVFAGRQDHQVKIRGFRIELGEIETKLRSHPAVKQCAVLGREDTPGYKQLVAYLIPNLDSEIAETQTEKLEYLQRNYIPIIHSYLKERMPEYMLPSFFVFMDRFPLTRNGKIDIKNLPSPDKNRLQNHLYVPPRTEEEESLSSIICDVLQLDSIGVFDNLYHIGIDSLLAMNISSNIQAHLNFNLTVTDILSSGTIAELANKLRINKDRLLPVIPSVLQKQNMLASLGEIGCHYCEHICKWAITQHIIKIHGTLDRNAITKSLKHVISQHEALRSCFFEKRNEHYRRVNNNIDQFVKEANLHTFNEEAQTFYIKNRLTESEEDVNTHSGPGILIDLLYLSDTNCYLSITVAHAVFDRLSLLIFFREVSEKYKAYHLGTQVPIKSQPIQYTDFVNWQREDFDKYSSADIDKYMKGFIDDTPPYLNLPKDTPPSMPYQHIQAVVPITIDITTKRKIIQISNKNNVTMFVYLLSVLNMFFSIISNQNDITIWSPISSRNDPRVNNIIGCFISFVIFRSKMDFGSTFFNLLPQTKEATLESFRNQIPVSIYLDTLKKTPQLNQISINYFSGDEKFEFHDLEIAFEDTKIFKETEKIYTTDKWKEEITIFFSNTPGGDLHSALVYNALLFNKETATRMANQLDLIIRATADNPHLTLYELKNTLQH